MPYPQWHGSAMTAFTGYKDQRRNQPGFSAGSDSPGGQAATWPARPTANQKPQKSHFRKIEIREPIQR
jgi:hypothetical protein